MSVGGGDICEREIDFFDRVGGLDLKTYEGMFVIDTGQSNFEEAVAPIRTVFERSEVQVLQLKKWEERIFITPMSAALSVKLRSV